MNSHYVPRLILNKFSAKLSLYNIKTGELKENIRTEKAYSQEGFYDDETEKKLNLRVESQFASLLANKLLKAENTIDLSRDELYLIKKFLLISVIRSVGNEKFLQVEKKFYDNLAIQWETQGKLNGLSESEIKARAPKKPFEERQIEGETNYQYWMRTLNVILDTNGTQEEIIKHPDKTYPAYRWSGVIMAGYLAFWDSEFKHDEFVITDIGMTSENEKGWNGITGHNQKKLKFLINLLEKEKDKHTQMQILKYIHSTTSFHENFQMFPMSAKRMIVLIAPFYKFRQVFKNICEMPDLEKLTCLTNENLYSPNRNFYVLPQDGLSQNYHDDDKYIYDIKKLSREETRYCNSLFMDRINTYLGFSSLPKAVGSIIKYKKLNDPPYVPRNDYTNLYKIIQERYLGSLNV
jgi:hypothetical protein